MDLSVVVVTFNSAACVATCLESVHRHLPGAEIVVVDNGSSDESAQIVLDARVRLLRNGRNLGFGRASNRGAAAASNSHLLFLNPDVVVTGCDTKQLADVITVDRLGLVGPRSDGATGIVGSRAEPTLAVEWLEHALGPIRPREIRQRPRKRVGQDWISGSMLLVRRSEFEDVGGFDRRFFLYYEDRDLAARYRSAGLPIRETTAFRGAHKQGASSALEELRTVPAGWAFLGWVEYLYLHRGRTTARISGLSSLTMLRTLHALLCSVDAISANRRVSRKRRQLASMLEFIANQQREPLDAESFCADARLILARRR